MPSLPTHIPFKASITHDPLNHFPASCATCSFRTDTWQRSCFSRMNQGGKLIVQEGPSEKTTDHECAAVVRERRKCWSQIAVGRSAAPLRAATRSDQLSSKLTVFMGVELDEADCGQLSLIPYFEGADGQTLRYRPAWRRKRRCLSTSGAAPAAIGTLTNSQIKLRTCEMERLSMRGLCYVIP